MVDRRADGQGSYLLVSGAEVLSSQVNSGDRQVREDELDVVDPDGVLVRAVESALRGAGRGALSVLDRIRDLPRYEVFEGDRMYLAVAADELDEVIEP